MAGCDYRSCDVCGGKAFYDVNLSYEDMSDENAKIRSAVPMRYAGAEQYSDPAVLAKHGQVLGYVGDWAVVCWDYSKTHRTQIVPIDPSTQSAVSR